MYIYTDAASVFPKLCVGDPPYSLFYRLLIVLTGIIKTKKKINNYVFSVLTILLSKRIDVNFV